MRQIERMAAGSLITLLFSGLTTLNVWAQGTAQISGVVKDNSGAVMPGVEVTAIQTDTDAKRTVKTDETGSFILSNLPIGPYRLEAVLSGFSTYVQSGIILQVNSNPVINPVMAVGQLTSTVEVSADAAMVETRNTGVGTVIDNQRVLELPLNGRQIQQLVTLVGMATVSTGNAAILNSPRRSPTLVITVAGGAGDGINYTLDGANHNDPYDNQAMQLPFPDAVQEFKVETGALAAQYGIHSNATVNAVTKSGTNSFHGDAFEFVRNGVFNARNFFAASRDTLKRNQFGGVLGGPIKKDKLFFFAAYQGTPVRSDPPTTISYVPTSAMLVGDFTTALSPQCNGGARITLASIFPDGTQGFVNNRISPSRFDPVAVNIAKLLPSTSDPCGAVSYGLKADQNEHDWTGRVDFQKSDKNFLFARTTISKLDVQSSYDGKDPLTLQNPATQNRTYALVLGDTYLIGPGTVNSFRASVNRATTVHILDVFKSWADLGANVAALAGPTMAVTVAVPTGAAGSLAASSALTIGGAPNATHSGPDVNLVDDISLVRGRHQIGLGVNYLYLLTNFNGTANCPGKSTVNGSWTAGVGSTNTSPLADFLMGRSATWLQGNCNNFYDRQNYIGIYAQDVWKINQRLTLSYGLRWEPYMAPYAKDKAWSHFDPTLFAQNVHSTVFPNAPAGLIFPGDSQYSVGNAPQGSSYAKFAPRVGLAWDPQGNGRMSIRAAYGMFTEHRFFYSLAGFTLAPPYGDQISLSAVSFSNPWANYPGGNPFPVTLNKNAYFPLAGTYSTQPFHYHPAYMNQWNVNIQRQIGADWLLTANYVGNNTIHFPSGVSVNPGVYVGPSSTNGNLNQRRVLYLQNPAQGQYYAGIYQTDDGATASYEGLLLSVQKRFSHNVSVLANDTWSHCISDVWDAALSQATGGSPPPGLRSAFRGNCQNGDIRQVFNLSGVFETPRFSNAALRRVASNWQLSPIMSVKSAQFFSVTTGTDVALSGQSPQYPNLVGNPYPSNQGINNWISIAAFQNAPAGQYGHLSPFDMKGPGAFQFDTAVSRTLAIREGMTIQLRGEAFNLLNHPVFAPPNAAMNSPQTFGRILSAGDPRILQFAVKYVF